jgi:hypothetical protein
LSSNKPSSIEIISLTNGSVIVKSNLVYSSTTSSSSSLQSFALSSLTSAASASTSSSFPVYSNSITITNCKLLYYYISVNKYIFINLYYLFKAATRQNKSTDWMLILLILSFIFFY